MTTTTPNLDFGHRSHSTLTKYLRSLPNTHLLQAMASATLPLPLRSHLTRLKPPISHAPRALACHVKLSHSHSNPFPPFSLLRSRSKGVVRPPSAYVSGPASDPIITEPDPKVESSNDAHDETVEPPSAISSSLLWSLLMRYKLRLAVSAVTLIGCSACTLSMPLFSGKIPNYSIYLPRCACLVVRKRRKTEGKQVLNFFLFDVVFGPKK